MKWRDNAYCLGADIRVFFPEKVTHTKDYDEARSACAKCSVRLDCLKYALNVPVTEDRTGVFAGTTARQREQLRQYSVDLLEWDEAKMTYRPLVWNFKQQRWVSASATDAQLHSAV